MESSRNKRFISFKFRTFLSSPGEPPAVRLGRDTPVFSHCGTGWVTRAGRQPVSWCWRSGHPPSPSKDPTALATPRRSRPLPSSARCACGAQQHVPAWCRPRVGGRPYWPLFGVAVRKVRFLFVVTVSQEEMGREASAVAGGPEHIFFGDITLGSFSFD